MYNRYIPQSDGTYQRRRMQDHPVPPPEPPRQKAPVPPAPSCPLPEQPQPNRPATRPMHRPCREPEPAPGIPEFLKQLLPKGLDAGDLLVIVLLLLMSGDCREDQNWALLTLMLYLFL